MSDYVIPAEPDVHETTQKVCVTPALARAWLDAYSRPENRRGRINPRRVAVYAEMMAAGRWECSGEHAITFAADGLIGNGHHRLWAVVVAKQPVWFMVRRGTMSIRYIDTNTQLRTHGQVGHMFGFDTSWDPALRAIDFARRVVAGSTTTSMVSELRMEALRATYADRTAAAAPVKAIRLSNRVLPAGVLAGAILMCGEPAGEAFVADLAATARLDGGSRAAKNLIRWLDARQIKGGGSSVIHGVLTSTVNAYEQFRLGESKAFVVANAESAPLRRLLGIRGIE
jgi:hypothetical protein